MDNILTIILIAFALTGCASNRPYNPSDPLEPINRGIYKFNDTVDKVVIKPVAKGYKAVMPTIGRTVVSNFFSNLDDVTVTVNDLLQFKLVQGFSDGMRFFVNSTVGIFGLIDVASSGGLSKHNEDFGQTLGKWGIGNGPYIVLPVLGPSTLRDSAGLYADGYSSPMYQMKNMRARNRAYATKGINRRAELLDQEKILNEAMIDPYEFMREAYLLHRTSQVYDGAPPRPRYDFDEGDDSELPQTPAAADTNPATPDNPAPEAPR